MIERVITLRVRDGKLVPDEPVPPDELTLISERLGALRAEPLKLQSYYNSLGELRWVVLLPSLGEELLALLIPAKRALLSSQVVQQMPDWVMITDLQAKIIFVNEAFYKITGYQPREVIGLTPSFLRSGYHTDEFYRDMWRRLKDGQPFQALFVNRHRSGRLMYIHEVIFPLRDDRGVRIGYASIARDVSRVLESNFIKVMTTDPVTSLPRREVFLRDIEVKLERAPTHLFSVMILLGMNNTDDLWKVKGFKHLENSLRLFVRILRKELEEEFKGKVLLGKISDHEIAAFISGVEDLYLLMVKLTVLFNRLGSKLSELGLSLTAGISIFPRDGVDASELLSKAGIGLKRAADQGLPFAFYSVEYHDSLRLIDEMDQYIRRALREKLFVIYYQPYLDLRVDKLGGLEALVRLKRGGELIPPPDFIPIMEERGYIVELTSWLISEICSQLSRWRQRDIYVPVASVNISPSQFKTSQGIKALIDTLEANSSCLREIALEITETAFIENLESIASLFKNLKAEYGVKISLDDFGTGFSSLKLLKELPLDLLKIDMIFTRGLPVEESSYKLVNSVINMGKAFNLKVVAEGVEREEQKRVLKFLGCDMIQGYLVAKPMPAEELENFMENWRANP